MVDASQSDVVEAIKELTSGRGVDVALVTAASTEAIQQALYSVAKRGTVLLLGIPPEKKVSLVFEKFYQDALQRELTIKGNFGKTQKDYKGAITSVASKQIDLSPLSFKEYDGLDKYEEACGELLALETDKRAVILP